MDFSWLSSKVSRTLLWPFLWKGRPPRRRRRRSRDFIMFPFFTFPFLYLITQALKVCISTYTCTQLPVHLVWYLSNMMLLPRMYKFKVHRVCGLDNQWEEKEKCRPPTRLWSIGLWTKSGTYDGWYWHLPRVWELVMRSGDLGDKALRLALSHWYRIRTFRVDIWWDDVSST